MKKTKGENNNRGRTEEDYLHELTAMLSATIKPDLELIACDNDKYKLGPFMWRDIPIKPREALPAGKMRYYLQGLLKMAELYESHYW